MAFGSLGDLSIDGAFLGEKMLIEIRMSLSLISNLSIIVFQLTFLVVMLLCLFFWLPMKIIWMLRALEHSFSPKKLFEPQCQVLKILNQVNKRCHSHQEIWSNDLFPDLLLLLSMPNTIEYLWFLSCHFFSEENSNNLF